MLTLAIFFVFVVIKPLSVFIAPLLVETLSEFTFILLALVPILLALVEILLEFVDAYPEIDVIAIIFDETPAEFVEI